MRIIPLLLCIACSTEQKKLLQIRVPFKKAIPMQMEMVLTLLKTAMTKTHRSTLRKKKFVMVLTITVMETSTKTFFRCTMQTQTEMDLETQISVPKVALNPQDLLAREPIAMTPKHKPILEHLKSVMSKTTTAMETSTMVWARNIYR